MVWRSGDTTTLGCTHGAVVLEDYWFKEKGGFEKLLNRQLPIDRTVTKPEKSSKIEEYYRLAKKFLKILL
ncbi:hypothetical protein Back11_31100 [Paenibacillus baekrokdamisoli]|uniref:Uncharacterized protein n=1 Tax=Paenibacillus baekrokdamisoli TaxID=1712516 RepID=A0A3G9J090_9BACL|nr:hypothetical protein [Paenibacillus baekrokdamisoli]MBB3071726.1 hypothetical protein [Paenibacillus baekrokdamisoli]BBH21765.1 hypothetical protein Back11_31100 [Paenibacillus baekrokdamisoli]